MLFTKGAGRMKVSLSTQTIGNDLIVCIFNEQGHLGAVAVAEYSVEEGRASTSVITSPGHSDDVIAREAAYKLCKRLKRRACVIAGVHLDDITPDEIDDIVRTCDELVDEFSRS
ncbi:MAG: hypothetical protein GXX84_03435 [Acidobacteria bacterium]|nr:hypothetical protein [Acidobacteriota bacterium]